MAVWDKDTQAFRHYAKLHETSLLVLKDGSIVTSDNPLPVTIGGDSITITGEVTIPGTIEISNDEGSPIPVHAHLYDESDNEYSASNPLPVTIISEPAVSIDGDVNVTQGSSPWVVGGTVALDSTTIQMLQQVTATVSGSVTVDEITNAVTIQDGGNSITVDGSVSVSNFPATQTVDGTVGISGDVNVTQGTDPWTVDGTVDVGNFPATQTVDGTVTIQDGGGSITVDGSVTVGNFPASQTVDGTVNIGNEVAINDGGNTISIDDGGGSITIDGNVNATIVGGETSFASEQTDAFGRLRVSDPYTLFDSSFRYNDNDDKWNHTTSGSGSVTFLENESSLRLSTNGTGEVIRETKNVFKYQPGKSLLIMNTFVMDTPANNIRQRVGYYGAQNGIMFQVDGTTKSFIIRSYISGSVDDSTEKVDQANWNTDKLDGTGPSGITLDVTRPQIFWMDIEWLGVGTVRCGFVIDGVFITCHKFHHANTSGNSGVYMTTATLPIRYELKTTSGTSAEMKQICSTAISEGGFANHSRTSSASTDLDGIDLSRDNYRPVVSIRLKSGYLDSVVIPKDFSVYGIQDEVYKWRLYWNANVTNGSWQSNSSSDPVEYNVTANNNISSGKILAEGIFQGRMSPGNSSHSGALAGGNINGMSSSYQLGRTISGTSDVFTLAVIATTTNDDAAGSITWEVHT